MGVNEGLCVVCLLVGYWHFYFASAFRRSASVLNQSELIYVMMSLIKIHYYDCQKC